MSIELLFLQKFRLLLQQSRYKLDFEEDCKIVKKCTEAVRKEVSAMYSKIEKFLQANKVESDVEDNAENHEVNDSNEEEEVECRCDWKDEDLILKYIELIEKQTDSLEEWKSKFGSLN